MLAQDALDAGRIGGGHGGEHHRLLVAHVPLDVGPEDVDEPARGRGLAGGAAQVEDLDQRVVMVSGEGDERGRAGEAAGAHGPV
jgi:hypothetical protein